MADTASSAAGGTYRKNLLDTSNMVITTVESVTDMAFIIHTNNDMSEALQALLQTKPNVSQPNSHISMRLYHINKNKFQLSLNGFFPVVGRFAKAGLK